LIFWWNWTWAEVVLFVDIMLQSISWRSLYLVVILLNLNFLSWNGNSFRNLNDSLCLCIFGSLENWMLLQMIVIRRVVEVKMRIFFNIFLWFLIFIELKERSNFSHKCCIMGLTVNFDFLLEHVIEINWLRRKRQCSI
jgi:hypothetical protein